jgi:hypothetical protein
MAKKIIKKEEVLNEEIKNNIKPKKNVSDLNSSELKIYLRTGILPE